MFKRPKVLPVVQFSKLSSLYFLRVCVCVCVYKRICTYMTNTKFSHNPKASHQCQMREGGEDRAEQGDEGRREESPLLVIKLQVHPVVDLIISQRHVVFKNRVPLFKNDLIPAGASLSRYQFLQVADGVIGVALNADFLS